MVLCLGVRQELVEIWSCVAPTVGSAAFELLLLRGVVCYSATAHQSCGPAWPSCHKPCVCFKLRFPPLGLDDNCCCDRYEVRLESCLQLWFRFTSLLTLHSAMCNVHTSPQVQVLLFPAGRITQQEKTPRFEASSFYTGNYFLQQSANINESAQRFVLWKLVWVKEMVGWFCASVNKNSKSLLVFASKIFFCIFLQSEKFVENKEIPNKAEWKVWACPELIESLFSFWWLLVQDPNFGGRSFGGPPLAPACSSKDGRSQGWLW